MRDISEDALEALKLANMKRPVLFCRGTSLVRIQTSDAGTSAEALVQASLRGILDRVANFTKVTDKGAFPARPPSDVIADILTLPDPGFPWLRGFSEAPVFLPSGCLLNQPGYDVESGLFLSLNNLESVRSDIPVQEAVSLLQDELLRDFPFADQGSKAHVIALLLLPFCRHLVTGATPLFLIDAPTKGNGKGLLVDVAAGISLGRPAQVMALPREEDELDKRITATLIQGSPMVLFDNVVSLKSTTLSAVLTTTSWRGRRLGKSEMVEAPNTTTWTATGNNVALSDEMVRRTVHIRLDAGVGRPEERNGFRHPDLMAWVRNNRVRLVSACLSIIQVWIDTGMPNGRGTLGRFERWVEVMGGILEVVGIEGFLTNREALYSEADPETREWVGLCEAWWDKFGQNPITAKDLLEVARENGLVLSHWSGRRTLAAQQRLGRALGTRRDRVFGDYRIRTAGANSQTKSAAYRLEVGSGYKTPETPETPGNVPGMWSDPTGVFENAPPQTPVAGEQNPRSNLASNTGVYGVSGVSSGPPINIDDVESI
jgi:hypothetical protein